MRLFLLFIAIAMAPLFAQIEADVAPTTEAAEPTSQEESGDYAKPGQACYIIYSRGDNGDALIQKSVWAWKVQSKYLMAVDDAPQNQYRSTSSFYLETIDDDATWQVTDPESSYAFGQGDGGVYLMRVEKTPPPREDNTISCLPIVRRR